MARTIPCRFADDTPVSPEVAEMLALAFGFGSARQMEDVIAAGEKKRKARGIRTKATILGEQIVRENERRYGQADAA